MRLLEASIFLCCLVFIFDSAKTSKTYDADVNALNAVFQKWGIKANSEQWNESGNPCTNAALDESIEIDAAAYNPFIKCDCSMIDIMGCRISHLKVYSQEVSGPIPDELWELTHLVHLNLGLNLLTGSLSPKIGNLSRLTLLSFGINSLSGPLPEELGLLTKMENLGLGSNNFSGSLPSSIGKLPNLQQLYIDSSGVSGEIPSTFSGLSSLRILWATSCNFGGKIPDFIGSWSNITILRLLGNNFEGPIPSTFSKLTKLTDLRLSDVSGASSSLDFIRAMTSLSILVLRGVQISDSIPDNIGTYIKMQQLDLSFNNISGQIPESLFSLGSLSHLFLGSNNLKGTLPTQKSSSLKNIDVSYNNLEGRFPSWANEDKLMFNPVANNFTIDQTTNSSLPLRINCLQRGFPCFRGSPRYSQFAVKCGGPRIKTANGIVYDEESEMLGPATYYVAETMRWAVSNNGYPIDNKNAQFTLSSQAQFPNTLDSEIFQSARISASSLRYYGLGLENGNYSLLLQFAEIAILNTKSWKSLGHRVFDIYIQGNRVLKDFNLRDEAGGVSFQPVVKSFKASVTENYLEIHFRWAGKGTCCTPSQGTFGPLVSSISVTSDFSPTVSNKPPSNKSNAGIIAGITVTIAVVLIALALFLAFAVRRRRMRQKADEELLGIENKPTIFTYGELKAATDNFRETLGEGGFGSVHKGMLPDGRIIAVKRLSLSSNQGKSQFVTEIATISAVQHRNLVKLYGCCIEGNHRLLVYEYLPNKSIDKVLLGNDLHIDWDTRYAICLGIARGLAYLHEESRIRIVHRDVKASNILLDGNLVPKISDFGLAKLYDEAKSHISTRVAGTIGYLAPEYAMRGHLTEKADVFAFGVVLLEIVSGRLNHDASVEQEKMYLLEWTWSLHEKKEVLELVDKRLTEFNEEEARRLVEVSLLCTQTSPFQRPAMSRVVAMLSGDVEVEIATSRPGYLSDWKFDDTSTMMSDTSHFGFSTNATSYSAGSSTCDAKSLLLKEIVE